MNDAIKILHTLLDKGNLNTYEKITCVALVAFSKNGYECSPSIKDLSELCSCSERQTIRNLNSLEKKGLIIREAQFIEVEHNARTTNKYTLNLLWGGLLWPPSQL